MSNFNERLQNVAFEKKVYQADIVASLKKDRATVSKWWNGDIIPGPKNLRLLADYFGCNYEWLATGDGPMFPYQPPPGDNIVFNSGSANTVDTRGPVAIGNGNIQAGRNINGLANPPLEKQRMEGFLDDDELALILEMREYGGKAMVKRFREEMSKIREIFEQKLKE